MSSLSKDITRSVYHEVFSDDSLVPSPSSSSTSSPISSSDSESNKRKVRRGPPTWNPFERYPEFLEREKWLKEEEENQLNSDEEFQRFVHDYEKYKTKDKVGVPFWEELRRSVPSFNFDAARDERYFVGYDEEGNEVRYDDEKYFLKRVRQSEILEFQAECRKVMKQSEDCIKRKAEEERKRKRDLKEKKGKNKKAAKMDDISFVGKKQGLWWRRGFKGMNVELKVVKRNGELQYVVVNKAQKGRKNQALQEEDKGNEVKSTVTEDPKILHKKMADKKNERPTGKDEVGGELKIATKKMNAVSYCDLEKVDDSDRDEDNLFRNLTDDKPQHSSNGNNTEEAGDAYAAQHLEKEAEFTFNGKFLSYDEKEEPELERRRSSNKCKNKSNNEEDDAGRFEHKNDEEAHIMPGFEEEAEFNEDENESGSDIDDLLAFLKPTDGVSQPLPRAEDMLKTKENYDSEDIETEEMHSYETKKQDRKKIKPKKVEETKEEEESKVGDEGEVKTAITFRHSLKFQKEMEEKKMEAVRQKVLHDLADMDVTIELLMMDLEGRDASDIEEGETQRNFEEECNQVGDD